MEPERVIEISEPALGLQAVLVIDSTALGPAAGGTRTFPYKNLAEATADARELARAMTLKCSIGGLAAGGAKCVVLDHPGLDRPGAFIHLGKEFEKLHGQFHTGGDFGTHPPDVSAMAKHCTTVHCEGEGIGTAVARGVVNCAGIAWSTICGRDLASARVAVQGLGEVGAPVARAFAARGARLFVSDVNPSRAREIAAETRAQVIPPEQFLTADVDILVPCAIGHILTVDALEKMQACIVCGAANNIFADEAAAAAYHAGGVIVVPDFLASAGGVIQGIAKGVMKTDPAPLITRMRDTTRAVLAESGELDEPPHQVAERMALLRVRKK